MRVSHTTNYFAAEIDKHAIKVTQVNYPNTIQLGDISKWQEWDLPQIDLLIGGSPCQGFSFAGKGLDFDDPRSKLFFTFADILDALKPKFFFLENVRMKKWCERIISERLDIDPVFIDSALVSAQTRKRLYWTNIPYYGKPKDKRIFLRDILETDVDEKYYLTDKMNKWLTSHSEKRGTQFKKLNGNQKASTLTATEPKQNLSNDYICVAMRGREDNNGIEQQLEIQTSGKTNAITGVQKDNLVYTEHYVQWDVSGKGYKSQQDRAFYEEGKHGTVPAGRTNNKCNVLTNQNIRRLTEIEVERLQTVPDNYTKHVSSTQRYKMLGNGWTVDVIAWFFEFMKDGEPRNVGILQRGLF